MEPTPVARNPSTRNMGGNHSRLAVTRGCACECCMRASRHRGCSRPAPIRPPLSRPGSCGLADAELERLSPGERSTRLVTEAIDEPKSAEREQQRQLLREDAPDLERQDDEVGL